MGISFSIPDPNDLFEIKRVPVKVVTVEDGGVKEELDESAAAGLEAGRPGVKIKVTDTYRTVLRVKPRKSTKGYVKKVYILLFAQLLFTAAVSTPLCINDPGMKASTQKRPARFIVALALMADALLAMPAFSRGRYPWNYIRLATFTLGAVYLLAWDASAYSRETIVHAVPIAVLLCAALILFAHKKKWEWFEERAATIDATLFVVVLLSFGLFITLKDKTILLHFACSITGLIVFSLVLLCDTKMMLRKPEDEIPYCAYTIYRDIIFLTIFMLTLVDAFSASPNLIVIDPSIPPQIYFRRPLI